MPREQDFSFYLTLLLQEALAMLHSYHVAPTQMPHAHRAHAHCPHTNLSTKDMPFLFLSLSLSTYRFLSYSPLPVKDNHKCRLLFFSP